MADDRIHVTGDYGPEMYVYIDDLPDQRADLREAWVTARDFWGLTVCGGAGQLVSTLGEAQALLVPTKVDRWAGGAESVYVLTDRANAEARKSGERRWKVALAIVAGEKERGCGGLDPSLFAQGAPLALVDFRQGFARCCGDALSDLVQGRRFLVRTHDPLRAVSDSDDDANKLWATVRQSSTEPSVWVCPRQDMAGGSLRVPGAWQTQQENIIAYLRQDETLWSKGEWRHAVVVQIDNDGCLVVGPGPEETLLVFPGDQPGSHQARLKGDVVVGGGMVIVAAVAELLRQGPLSHDGLVRQARIGLAKARRLLEVGYREVPAEPSEAEEPPAPAAPLSIRNHRRTTESLFPLELLDRTAQEEGSRPHRYEPLTDSFEEAVRLLECTQEEFARRIVFNLEKWSTCDPVLAEHLLLARDRVERHVSSTQNKVLNFAVFGGPGSGKSFMVEQLQASVGDPRFVTMKYNVSQFRTLDHLRDALLEIQTESLKGNVPFVQWDEFDCGSEGGKGIWLSRFLMPMQDAAFADGTDERALGTAVFVFIGGTFADAEEFRKWASGEGKSLKGPDFHSRLDRVLEVPSVDLAAKDTTDTPYLNRALTLRRDLREQGVRSLERPVARLLLGEQFRHGMRSLKTIVGASTLKSTAVFCVRHLPPSNVLEEHLTNYEQVRAQLARRSWAGEDIKIG